MKNVFIPIKKIYLNPYQNNGGLLSSIHLASVSILVN